MEGLKFQVGALPLSAEDLKGLENLMDSGQVDMDYPMSIPETAYAKNLERFGEVRIPPPSYVAFIRFCREHEVEINSIDMDDEHYTMAYCKHVSGSNWIMQSFREKRLLKRRFTTDDPLEFALQWDTEINKLKGYRELEEHREEVMAKNLHRLSKKGLLFSIMEVERLQGVVAKLEKKGFRIIR